MLWLYFFLAYAFSWLIWSPAVLATYGLIDSPLPLDVLTALVLLFGAFGPLFAAILVTARTDGRVGVRRLLARGLQWRTLDLPALALIVGLPLAGSALARALDTATGGSPPSFALGSPLALIPTFVFILLLGGPIQEEFGWRGYALDRLLTRWGPWVASLILGVAWAFWHLPFWFMGGAGMEGTSPWEYLLYTVALTLNMTWLHLRTSGSVLAAILMHTTANFVSNLLPVGGAVVMDSRAYLFRALVYAVVGVALLALTARRQPATEAKPSR